ESEPARAGEQVEDARPVGRRPQDVEDGLPHPIPGGAGGEPPRRAEAPPPEAAPYESHARFALLLQNMGEPLHRAEALLRGSASNVWAGGRGARIALAEPTRAWTYDEVLDTVARLGGALTTLGVKPGDRVAVLMPDGLEAATALLAAIYVGAI